MIDFTVTITGQATEEEKKAIKQAVDRINDSRTREGKQPLPASSAADYRDSYALVVAIYAKRHHKRLIERVRNPVVAKLREKYPNASEAEIQAIADAIEAL